MKRFILLPIAVFALVFVWLSNPETAHGTLIDNAIFAFRVGLLTGILACSHFMLKSAYLRLECLTGLVCLAVIGIAGYVFRPSVTLRVPEQYNTIQQAIDACRPGDTILIGEGSYQGPLNCSKSIKMVGAGTINAPGGAPALTVRSATHVEIQGITFVGSTKASGHGSQPAHALVQVIDTDVDIIRCAFQDGPAEGLVINGGGARIERCKASANRLSGFVIKGKNARAVFTQTTSMDNREDGFTIRNQANAKISECEARSNSEAGFVIAGEATADLLNNTSIGNKPGIFFSGGRGYAEKNICQNNQGGIVVRDLGSHAVLKANLCAKNEVAGIAFDEFGEGVAEDNICSDNKGWGIIVTGFHSSPKLVRNRLENNVEFGLTISDDASPQEIAGNVFGGNKKGETSMPERRPSSTISNTEPARRSAAWSDIMNAAKSPADGANASSDGAFRGGKPETSPPRNPIESLPSAFQYPQLQLLKKGGLLPPPAFPPSLLREAKEAYDRK